MFTLKPFVCLVFTQSPPRKTFAKLMFRLHSCLLLLAVFFFPVMGALLCLL